MEDVGPPEGSALDHGQFSTGSRHLGRDRGIDCRRPRQFDVGPGTEQAFRQPENLNLSAGAGFVETPSVENNLRGRPGDDDA